MIAPGKMERRRNLRRARHVAVRFYARGDRQGVSAYTTDISLTGMFINTNQPLAPGERVRVEVTGDNGFVIEGVVARASRVATHLQAIKKPGMGVRFLSADELVAAIVATTPFSGPAPGAAAGVPANGSPGAAAAGAGASTADPAAPPPPQVTFPVRFRDVAQFLQTYRRDITTGGLFVATPNPARLSDTITVELYIPGADENRPLNLRARVVHRFEPQSNAGGPNLLAGMGVELVDRLGAVALLEPIVRRLEQAR